MTNYHNYFHGTLTCAEIAERIAGDFAQAVPMYLRKTIAWYLKYTGVSLLDATKETFREKAKKNSKWDQMFMNDDYKEILPQYYTDYVGNLIAY